MSNSHSNARHLQDVNQSILNHLFLPFSLPSSADADFCIRSNHRHEYVILECMNEYLNFTNKIIPLPILQSLIECTQRWSNLQKLHNLSVPNLQSTIEQLPPGSFFPLYIHAQNAAILIEIDEKHANQALISSWQVLLPIDAINSSLQSHLSCFPVPVYRILDRSYLSSTVHVELLMDFMQNTIEYAKYFKDSREIVATRDVPVSHYVCQWWIQRFPGIMIEVNNCKSLVQFTKKHRDQVRWYNGPLPFRRSGLWTTIKVVFQTILTKCLDNIGTIVYKLLITHFLTYIMSTRKKYIGSIDLLVHCLRKILRRLNKIDTLLVSADDAHISHWIEWIKHDIQKRINENFPNNDWQASIQINEQQKNKELWIDLHENDAELYRHSFQSLKNYLNPSGYKNSNKISFNFGHCDHNIAIESGHFVPSFDILTNNFKYSTEIALTRMELWILSWTDQWMNQRSTSRRETERFQTLSKFFDNYQDHALTHYSMNKISTDPIGYSRFLLVSFTIIRVMHEKLCQDQRFERLRSHRIDIPNMIGLFEHLILPNQDDMIRVRDLYDYFRKFEAKSYPDLLEDIEDDNSFGVFFAMRSTKINNSLRKLQAQIEQEKMTKIQEVRHAKDRYTRLMNSIIGHPCTCYAESSNNQCRRCRIEYQASNIDVDIYESPLPTEQASALAVMFELRMPLEIRCYRDVLWQFRNRLSSESGNLIYEWLRVRPHSSKLEAFFTGPNNYKVKLVSSKNSITQNHNTNLSIPLASVDDFIYENSLDVKISPIQPVPFQDECRILTPKLLHPDYQHLQFSIESTKFVQNQVIANLPLNQHKLQVKQFIEFGSFRSGHRLQWWNLLSVLEMDSLPLNEESVAILILHAILQYGPLTDNSNLLLSSWCPESHEPLLNDHFVDELILRLNRHLDECKSNWQNEFILIIITLITMRVFTLCNATRENQMISVVFKCRCISESWMTMISTTIQKISSTEFNVVENLRFTMASVGLSCLLTFLTNTDRFYRVFSSNEHMISLLKASTTLHDNLTLANKSKPKSEFLRNLIRLSERELLQIQPRIAEFLQKSSFHSLDDFTAIYWSEIRNEDSLDAKWKKRYTDIYDGWYDGQYESTNLSINCLEGIFLVNGMSIDYLPHKILTNELYLRVFENHMFQVQIATSFNTYITKYSYHDDERVQYEFYFDDQLGRLIVHERHLKTNDLFELIPPKCLENELPYKFVSEYSHWKHINTSIIEFRPVRFQDPDFLRYKSYLLNIETGYIVTDESLRPQILVNQSSLLFQNLFRRYFVRLDEQPYIYMMRENDTNVINPTESHTDAVFNIYLSRLGIAFKYDIHNNCLTSREYSDMHIDQDQWIGTLTGLTSGLLLTSIKPVHQQHEKLQYRKLIIPFGHVTARRQSLTDHQTVMIQRNASMSYAQQYFVFVLNDRLRVIQSTDSPTGWLYLALLHAMTSHCLPDQYTEMTGMERAFQLLNSAGCWSDQPFDLLSLNILRQIAAISPKACYHQQQCHRIPKIDWHDHGLPYSLQHAGYYLAVKRLIKASERFYFMYLTPYSNKFSNFIDCNEYDEKLLTKLFWDYRDFFNPIIQLSAETEAEILTTNTERPYEPSIGYSSPSIHKENANIVIDMYHRGDLHLKDISKLCCFPLSKWLTDEYQFKNIWISLLKLADSIKITCIKHTKDDTERFDLLLDFLLYTSNRYNVQPVYLQMLKTVLYEPDLCLQSIQFPPFIQYENIQHISVTRNAIEFDVNHTANERRTILEEIQNCFETKSPYKDTCHLATSEEKQQIKLLLKSWQLNRKLNRFLTNIQNLFDSYKLMSLKNYSVPVHKQCFRQQSLNDYFEIKLKPVVKEINQEILLKAQQKYLYPNSQYFFKSIRSRETPCEQNQLPFEIFSSIDDEKNHLNEIGSYFKSHFIQSWKQFQSTTIVKREYPSEKEIIETLESFYEETAQFWKELIKSFTDSNQELLQSGLLPRLTPFNLISLFQQIWLNDKDQSNVFPSRITFFLTMEQCILLGGLIVNWTLEQQIERALNFISQNKREEFEQELSNTPHVNWIPAEHLPWLILELEMNITIREIQVDVARHMMQPKLLIDDTTAKSFVMQMNMGEGKTSIIIPMLALSLCSPLSSLVRIIILKSLFPTNYQCLRYKLGGLLNRRIFPFTCHRDINFSHAQITEVFNRFKQALLHRDVVLVSPEDILSFDLLTIDKCRRKEFVAGRSMLILQRWFKTFIRDVMDESDEILHCKYQLIYTIGNQKEIEGGAERWKCIQSVLYSVRILAADIAQSDPNDVFYRSSKHRNGFPEFRLLSHRLFLKLCQQIANNWLHQKSFRKIDHQYILSFILDIEASMDNIVDRFSSDDVQSFLIMRGLLAGEILFIALKKRYRVDYGVDINSKLKRSMAVPFRAKDVPVERTEFGHPDLAFVLTQLSYYYCGLNDKQIILCFDRLNREEQEPEAIYAEWIAQEDHNHLPKTMRQWKSLNLKDCQQEITKVFNILRYNTFVIDYFLNYFVYPREVKQYPNKLISSAWDLSTGVRVNPITGFSGTNDTQLLLPVHVHQCDLPQLKETDATVIHNLMKLENEIYRHLSANATSDMILEEIVHYQPIINVILDVGALLVDGCNRDIAIDWLKRSDRTKIDYAIYFEFDSIFVCDRQYSHYSFLTSPAREQLDRCIIYLDEVHTRGVDMKFPTGFKGAVTLGKGLTKDRFVQACMRMRKLGKGHSLTFWSSDEAHRQILWTKIHALNRNPKSASYDDNHSFQLTDILRWVYENTQQATWDGLHHWAVQSLSFQRKISAFRNIQWMNKEQIYSDEMMEELARHCLEPEILTLKLMFGQTKIRQTIADIYINRYQQSKIFGSENIHQAVLQRISTYGGTKQRLSQIFDEEQQREFEYEFEQEEERQKEEEHTSIRLFEPCSPILHDEIKMLCNQDETFLHFDELPCIFQPLPYAFIHSTFFEICQPESWHKNFWITTEFQRVIQNSEDSLDEFLRPPRWLIVYRNQHIVFVTAFEASWLMGRLQEICHQSEFEESSNTTLRLLIPRLKRSQSIFVNIPTLTTPPFIGPNYNAIPFVLPLEWIVQLFVFNGTIYFETIDEQTAYCQCLALCPKPRTMIEDRAFEDGWISVDGFVEELKHRCNLQIFGAQFISNPLPFVKQLLKQRNSIYTYRTSHIGSIIFNGWKRFTSEKGK